MREPCSADFAGDINDAVDASGILMQLTERQRLIVVCRARGYSGPYLADAFGISHQAVYALVKRARLTLLTGGGK